MVQLRPSLFITDAYGSAGDVTAYHRGGKCFLRKRITSTPVGGGVSQSTSAVHLRALQAWRSLPHDEQLRWAPLAEIVEPHRPPFDHKARISGNNLFISAYHGFATLGREHIPSPLPFEAFPAFRVVILGASAIGRVLEIRIQLDVDGRPARYRLLAKLQLTKPGAGRDPGKLRNYLAVGTAGDQVVTVSISDYMSVSGMDLPAYQVHARFILLDTETGYRSQFLPVSDLVEL